MLTDEQYEKVRELKYKISCIEAMYREIEWELNDKFRVLYQINNILHEDELKTWLFDILQSIGEIEGYFADKPKNFEYDGSRRK